MKWLPILFLWLVCVCQAQMGRFPFYSPPSISAYYVANDGSNDNDGRSPETPWQTLAKVNTSTFAPGDYIFFKCGDTWRESAGLNVHNSGTPTGYITYSSYGTGAKPKFYGSVIVDTWVNISGNIWASDDDVTDPYVESSDGEIYYTELDGSIKWGHKKKTWTYNLSNLTSEYDWTWHGDSIYIYAATDPDDRYTKIEVAQYLTGVDLNSMDYIEISGIEFKYFKQAAIMEEYPSDVTERIGLRVHDCDISYLSAKNQAGYGVFSFHSDTWVYNNVFHDCGRRGVSINDWSYGIGRVIRNCVIENNEFYNGYHTTGIDIIVHGQDTVTLDSTIIRNNYIHDIATISGGTEDPVSESIYISHQGTTTGSVITGLWIYNNIIINPSSSGIELENARNAYIFNNTFVSGNTGVPLATGAVDGLKILGAVTDTVHIKNNLFYGLQDHTINANSYLLNVSTTISSLDDVDIDYNLYYHLDAETKMAAYSGTAYYTTTWSDYKTATDQDANSPTPADPNLTATYELNTGSPAINTGVDVGLTVDYAGNPIDATPDIGAYEKQ